MLGAEELSALIDARADLRRPLPSLLGLRDLGPLLDAGAVARGSLDVDGACELARVFVPTRAHAQALEVLDRHRFVVPTGPPEVGKTAIARIGTPGTARSAELIAAYAERRLVERVLDDL